MSTEDQDQILLLKTLHFKTITTDHSRSMYQAGAYSHVEQHILQGSFDK